MLTRTDAQLPQWPGLQEAMDDVRAFGAAHGREKMIVLSPQGNRIYVNEGDNHQVEIPDPQKERIHGALLVHNHPTWGELSTGDLGAATAWGAAGVMAVMPDGSWSLAKGIRSLPNEYDGFLFDVFRSVSHPFFAAVAASNEEFQRRLGGEVSRDDPRFVGAIRFSNRAGLAALGDNLLDYRLHLNDEAKMEFRGVPGLDLS